MPFIEAGAPIHIPVGGQIPVGRRHDKMHLYFIPSSEFGIELRRQAR